MNCGFCDYTLPESYEHRPPCGGCGGSHLVCADCGYQRGVVLSHRTAGVGVLNLSACPAETVVGEAVLGDPDQRLSGVEAAQKVLSNFFGQPLFQETPAQLEQYAYDIGLPIAESIALFEENRLGLRLADGREVWLEDEL